jgi:Putative ATP-binding cassette
MAALALSLIFALGLGALSWAATLTRPSGAMDGSGGDPTTSREGMVLLFVAYASIFVAWATVSLSAGRGNRFNPGRLLVYPISLRRLFAIDLLSELTSLTSIFAVPAMFAIAIGAGVGSGNLLMALPIAAFATAFGISLAKWLATSVGALLEKRRARGETVLALFGALFALGSVLAGQLLPYWTPRANDLSFRGMRWTPPGAAATGLFDGLNDGGAANYALSLVVLAAYTAFFIIITYRIARRAALGAGGSRRASPSSDSARALGEDRAYTGWQLPSLSTELSAVIEKEWHYAMRNPQLRTLALMPLILIIVKLAQTSGFNPSNVPSNVNRYAENFALYGEGLLAAGGVLYVFMVLSSLVCNLFAYEGAGMRALVLAPVDRRTILIGKNITLTFIALLLSTVLIIINQLIFRDLTTGAISFVALSFVMFAALFMALGNWLSVRFPKRLEFGKRMNAAGVSGLLLIPVMAGMAALPLLAAVAGYLAQSLFVKYGTLLVFAGVALLLYVLLITRQGHDLARRELEILETVSGRTEN